MDVEHGAPTVSRQGIPHSSDLLEQQREGTRSLYRSIAGVCQSALILGRFGFTWVFDGQPNDRQGGPALFESPLGVEICGNRISDTYSDPTDLKLNGFSSDMLHVRKRLRTSLKRHSRACCATNPRRPSITHARFSSRLRQILPKTINGKLSGSERIRSRSKTSQDSRIILQRPKPPSRIRRPSTFY